MRTAILLSVLAAIGPLRAATDLADPDEPWLTSRTGITTNVIGPFEPLELEGEVVKLWGRRYVLGGIFPTQMDSQGEELLTGPIGLIVGLGGDTTRLAASPPEFSSVAADRIEYGGAGRVGPLTLTTRNWVEYDGVVQISLTVKAAEETTIESLAVEVPLRSERARYLHQFGRWGPSVYKAIGSDDDWQWSAAWAPYLWVGDDDRGLTFVTETRAGWAGAGDRALQLSRDPEGVTLRANIISEPTPVTGERVFTFGLHATPSKPLAPNWHGRHCGPLSAQARTDYFTNIGCVWSSSTKWFSYPQPADPVAFDEHIKVLHAGGVKAAVYISTSGTGPESAVFQRHRDEWLMTDGGKPLYGDESVEGRGKGMVSVCPASSFADFLVWGVERLIQDYDVDGVYIDNASPYHCDNTAHGCGAGGEKTYPYFASRELQKRLWAVVKRHDVDGIVWEHTSRESNSMNLSYVDIYSDGEQFRNPEHDKYAIDLDNITPTFLRITATGRQWGAQPCFLVSAINTREEITDWLLARFLPYGNVLWAAPGWMDFSRLHPVLRARWDFGLEREQVEWFTPDRPPSWLVVRPAEVLAGGYVRSDRQVLLTLSNITGTHVDARIRVAQLQAYLGAFPQIADATTDSPCEWRGPEAWITIPANSFRVLRIGPKPDQE